MVYSLLVMQEIYIYISSTLGFHRKFAGLGFKGVGLRERDTLEVTCKGLQQGAAMIGKGFRGISIINPTRNREENFQVTIQTQTGCSMGRNAHSRE